MGNCIGCKSASTWTDGDLFSSWEREEGGGDVLPAAAEEPAGPLKRELATVLPPTGKLRIKISKKDLEKLLQMVEAQRLPLEQVLVNLASAAAQDDDAAPFPRCRQSCRWRPTLESIAETTD